MVSLNDRGARIVILFAESLGHRAVAQIFAAVISCCSWQALPATGGLLRARVCIRGWLVVWELAAECCDGHHLENWIETGSEKLRKIVAMDELRNGRAHLCLSIALTR